jgi:hypothetical protein
VVFVNIDKPTQRCTIHTNKTCGFLQNRYATPLKGIGVLKKNGGWLSFDGIVVARKFCKAEFGTYTLIEHC